MNEKLKNENVQLKLKINSLEMELESFIILKKIPHYDNDNRSVHSYKSNTSKTSYKKKRLSESNHDKKLISMLKNSIKKNKNILKSYSAERNNKSK